MVRIPTHQAPIHPGEILQEEFLKPQAMTQRELADALHIRRDLYRTAESEGAGSG